MNLFSTPATDLNAEAIRAFLRQQHPEGVNLEYKRELTGRALEAIAAMANTYGGILLVGVAESKGLPEPEPQGVPLETRDRLVNQCITKLEPPFSPEVIPVRVNEDSDRYVLVVRIQDDSSLRPVFLDGRVSLRLPGRNVFVGRRQVAAMFTEGLRGRPIPNLGGGGQFLPWMRSPLLTSDQLGLVIRVVTGARMPPDASRVLSSAVRQQLGDALLDSSLERWFIGITDRLARVRSRAQQQMWERTGYSNARSVTFQRPPRVTRDEAWSVSGQAVLEMLPEQMVTLFLDIALTTDVAEDMPEPYLAGESLYGLLHPMLESLTEGVVSKLFPAILGLPIWENIGFVCHVDTHAKPLSQFVRLLGYPETDDASDAGGGSFEVDSGVDIQDPTVRDRVIKEWLIELHLNHGHEDIEEEIDDLVFRG